MSKGKLVLVIVLSLVLISTLLITGCVPKKAGTTKGTDAVSTEPTTTASLERRIASLESVVTNLQNRMSSAQNYDTQITSLQGKDSSLEARITSLETSIARLETSVNSLTQSKTQQDTSSDDTTRWSVEAWTDTNLVEVYVDAGRIDDEDDYTIYLQLYNRNYTTSGSGANITYTYKPVTIKTVTVQFSPKSGDRVFIDDVDTDLYGEGYPSFDWDVTVKERNDGTCKRIEAVTSTRSYVVPIPTRFHDDQSDPYPVEFKLNFELVYK